MLDSQDVNLQSEDTSEQEIIKLTSELPTQKVSIVPILEPEKEKIKEKVVYDRKLHYNSD